MLPREPRRPGRGGRGHPPGHVSSADHPDDAPPPGPTPFDRLGGESGVRALVDRFYDLMDLEPAYARLRAVHGSTLADARDKLFWFLCGWLGGPDHYIQRFGHPRLRARHLPFRIGSVERDQWLACMFQAMQELNVERSLAERLEKSLFDTADWMRNTPG
ncbi:group II truncated hemoglobin [Ideonella sp. 4Y16]|uniref:Group II truncated hemoglobin n=1 Tax=Ideonella alba TaxID=2824118 RepID=A0A941BCX4_9BURK|nr:group II truncated hemoglobin [Ideonella alba]MBQ0941853.1 group II truncated hemoglobin [Ideonella alba]